jgi:hypothetical protein
MENNGRRCLAEKLDRDLRWDFIHRFLNFVGGLGQPIGVDVDPDATTRTGHVLVRLDPPDGLMEILPAIGTLKSDLMHFNVRHGGKRSFCGIRIKSILIIYYVPAGLVQSIRWYFVWNKNIVVAGPRFLRNQS